MGITAAGLAGSRLLARNGTVWAAPCSGKVCSICPAGSYCGSCEVETEKGGRDG